MDIDDMKKVAFELSGGWFAVIASVMFSLIKWSMIACLFALAYRFIVR